MLQILDSECFSKCKEMMGHDQFLNFAHEKIIPIQGDVMQEQCGLSNEDHQLIISKVQIMINSAASVSFDDSLHDSINMNYLGSMRMLDLAKQTKIKYGCLESGSTRAFFRVTTMNLVSFVTLKLIVGFQVSNLCKNGIIYGIAET